MRSIIEQRKIYKMWRGDISKRRASRILRIPRRTVVDWYRRFDKTGAYPNWQQETVSKTVGMSPWRFESSRPYIRDRRAYAYILGIYLGDGCVSRMLRTYSLRIFQDGRYTKIVDEIAGKLRRLFFYKKVSVRSRGNCAIVSCCSKILPWFFPQYGSGPKHLRKIKLMRWQSQIAKRHVRDFIRGLIHSDGCRYVNRTHELEYVNYCFSNVSKDILGIFVAACKMLRIEYRYGHNQVVISRRESVKILDGFVGAKA